MSFHFNLKEHEDQIEFGLNEFVEIQEDVRQGRYGKDEADRIMVEVALELGRLYADIKEALGADVFGIYVKVRWAWVTAARVERLISYNGTHNAGNMARAHRRRQQSDA